jgi:glycosyltransferase involved in cell wall biosynthesis
LNGFTLQTISKLITVNLTFLISSDFPEGVSKNARIKSYAYGLLEAGHKVEILVGFCTKINADNSNSGVEGEWRGISYKYLSGTTQYYQSQVAQLLIFFKSTISLIVEIFRQRKHDKFWVIYGSTYRDFLFIIPLLRWTGQHQVVVYTELPSLLGSNFLSKITEKLLVKYADKILVVSNNLLSYFQKKKAEVQKITPIVVQEDRFQNIQYRRSNTIGYLGTFGAKDDVPFIINAFLQAQKKIDGLKLNLMGFIPNENDLKHISDLCNAHESITYHGKLSSEEVPLALAKCDTLIMNRTDSEYSRTGFPIKLAEYLSTGIPTLVTNFEEYHEYLSEDIVHYYEPDNQDDFVRCLVNRYDNEDTSIKMAHAGRKKVSSLFGTKKASKELNLLFEEIVRGKE